MNLQADYFHVCGTHGPDLILSRELLAAARAVKPSYLRLSAMLTSSITLYP